MARADGDRDDSFARILDDTRDEHDIPEEAAPSPARVEDTPERPAKAEAANDKPSASASFEQAAAANTFKAELNSLNADDVPADQPKTETENAAASATVKPATATATTQANAALLALANATGAAAGGATAVTDAQDADTHDDTAAGDTSLIAAMAGATQTLTAQAVAPISQRAGGGDAGIQTKGNAGIVPPGIDAAEQAAGNAAAGTDAKPSAAAIGKTASPAQAATQTANPAAAAISPESAAKAAVDPTPAPGPQASIQTAATSNPLSDASRATATPPALQSAPAATIEVYSRIIERADGRAQRFEVRLDPVELGRVDVRIEIGADKKVHAVLAAHDSAALSDLMRGQRALERALSDAGIDIADNGVRFEMSNDANRGSANQQRGESNTHSGRADVWRSFDTLSMPVSAETAAAATPMRRTQRLDLVA